MGVIDGNGLIVSILGFIGDLPLPFYWVLFLVSVLFSLMIVSYCRDKFLGKRVGGNIKNQIIPTSFDFYFNNNCIVTKNKLNIDHLQHIKTFTLNGAPNSSSVYLSCQFKKPLQKAIVSITSNSTSRATIEVIDKCIIDNKYYFCLIAIHRIEDLKTTFSVKIKQKWNDNT